MWGWVDMHGKPRPDGQALDAMPGCTGVVSSKGTAVASPSACGLLPPPYQANTDPRPSPTTAVPCLALHPHPPTMTTVS